jgi:hypothetical protein
LDIWFENKPSGNPANQQLPRQAKKYNLVLEKNARCLLDFFSSSIFVASFSF